jgi:hypothetical protein
MYKVCIFILHIRKFCACTLCTLYNTITGDQGLRYVHTTHTSYNFTHILYLVSVKCQYHRQQYQISAYPLQATDHRQQYQISLCKLLQQDPLFVSEITHYHAQLSQA